MGKRAKRKLKKMPSFGNRLSFRSGNDRERSWVAGGFPTHDQGGESIPRASDRSVNQSGNVFTRSREMLFVSL